MTAPKPVLRAIVLDFDGVVLESLDIKTDVFRRLFHSFPKQLPSILRYHTTHAGVSRFQKFDYIYSTILRQPLRPSQRRQLGKDFSRLVFERVLRCRFVRGAQPFLKTYSSKFPLYVASATPGPELRKIVRRRGLGSLFKNVYGHPITKKEAIQKVLQRHALRPVEVVMVGDARADWEAARANGTCFVGRVPRRQSSPFPSKVPTITDLSEFSAWLKKMYTLPSSPR